MTEISPAPPPTPVLREDDPHRLTLEAQGWTVVARSFGAALTADAVDVAGLRALVAAVAPDVVVRPLGDDDVDAVLALDGETLADYPGGPATAHPLLTPSRAASTSTRQGFGAFAGGALVAMTFVDRDGEVAETDFTAVAATSRRRGLASAVKAASVLALLDAGVTRFRTGGAAENEAIVRANERLGYVVDERWYTYAPPAVALPGLPD